MLKGNTTRLHHGIGFLKRKHRIAGTYSEKYKQVLLQWEMELNRKALAEKERS
jgi:hypothetical protein